METISRNSRQKAKRKADLGQIPPLPHPYKGVGGSAPFTFLFHGGALSPMPLCPCALPPGGGLPKKQKAVSESLHRVGPTAAAQPPPYEGTRAYLSPSGI